MNYLPVLLVLVKMYPNTSTVHIDFKNGFRLTAQTMLSPTT
jgi:hypothetical protein